MRIESISIMNNLQHDDYWTPYAHTYDDGVDYVLGRPLRETIANRLSRERRLGRVLECGCGTGFYSKEIVRHADSVIATDISPSMLALARQRLAAFENITFQMVNAEKLPFLSGMFDTILLANLLNTVKEPLAVLRESFRVLKYGGLVIVVTYTDFGMAGDEKTSLALRYFQKFGFPPSWGLRNFDPPELQGLVTEAGFSSKPAALLGDHSKAIYLKAFKRIRKGPDIPG